MKLDGFGIFMQDSQRWCVFTGMCLALESKRKKSKRCEICQGDLGMRSLRQSALIWQAIFIGCPSEGKSTFARKLRDKTGLPLYYLDLLWHRPDKINFTPEQFDARLTEILETDKWIIDGNYTRTLEMRINACDTMFLLDFPLDVCLAGAKERIGQKREDMPWIEKELDEDFWQWILDFPNTQLPKIYNLLEPYKKSRKVYIFHSRAEADHYFEEN